MTASAPRLLGPGGRTLTAEQSAAVRRRDGSLLVEAGAGSGKTSVLVERFVRSVLEDGVRPGRILAITFTERAAGELRARVRARFAELGRRDEARETENAWVSTIHGFCARVLRAHAALAGVDPGFAVLDEAAARPLRARAWDAALARALDGARGAEALDLLAAYDVDRLRAAIERVHDALRSAGRSDPRLPRPPRGADPATLRAPLREARAAAAAELGGARDGPAVARARARLERCARVLAADDRGAPPAAVIAELALPANAGALRSAACDAYRAALDAYARAARDARAAAAVELLDILLVAFADAYADAKRARAVVDFDDLELHVRDLLSSDDGLRRSYAERFDRVMVDELQDSNPLQLELFEALDRDSLFCVGDELQSIYGFRHADVEVFRTLRARLAADGRTATLRTNFRSRPEILACIDAAFAPRFGPAFAGLRAGRAQRPAGEPRVELYLTDQRGWDEVGLGELGSPGTRAWRRAEARLLAQRVRELVDGGAHAPEEIVVLLRALTELPVYERALADQGLQTLSVGGGGYWGRQVVRDLCAWLAALANPRDEVALYGVLASPLVGLSSDALAHVARAGPGRAWRAIAGDEGLRARLGADDRERLEAFAARFAAERALAPRLGLDELLRRAVERTGYDLHVLSLAGGTRRLANVHKLQRLAAAFERDRGRDVRGLADLAAAELEADARETDAPVELGGARAVRLMSIHAAKGLEFPVVCVADLGRRRPGGGVDDDLLVEGDRIGLRLVGLDGSSEPALEHEALRDRARRLAAREEDRILYVALTRAQERLVLSGGVTLDAWPAEGPQAPPLAWLAPALLGGDLGALAGADAAVVDVACGGAQVRCAVNRPDTVGRVLRAEALAPAIGGAAPATPPQPAPVAAAAGGPAAAAPPAGGPAPRTISYSALASWHACGYRHYLQRVLALPDEPVADDGPGTPRAIDARTRGWLVHALLEREEAVLSGAEDAAGGAAGGAGDARATAAAAAIAADADVALEEGDAAAVARLAAAFAGSPLARRLRRARAVEREHGFALPLGGVLLTGVVDVLARERGGASLVVDYKTDALEPDTDLAAYVELRYGIQRRAYALAALRAGAARVEVAYAFLERPGEPVAERYEKAAAAPLERELLRLSAGLRAGRYPVAAEPHRELCLTCPGRRALCSYPEELTLRERRAVGDP